MTILESNNRHEAESRTGLEYLKQLSASLDGWNLSSETKHVKVYSRDVEGSTWPIVRGETVLVGDYTIHQVAAVALAPGCRHIWDDRFDGAEIKEFFNYREALFYSKLKGNWPVSGRDLAATTIRDISEDTVYISMVSVEDSTIPVQSSHVRAQLHISGWKISKVPEGVALTYITHVDIKGSIPSALIKLIQLQIPLCAGRVAQYVKENGHPPFLIGDFTGKLKREVFDHGKKEYVLEAEGVDDEEGSLKLEVGNAMYPKGFKLKIHGEAESEEIEGENGIKYVVISGFKSPVTVTIARP